MKCQLLLRYLCCLYLIINEFHRNVHFHVVAVNREYRIDKLLVHCNRVQLEECFQKRRSVIDCVCVHMDSHGIGF